MAKPPPSGAHSDIKGVNMDARVNAPNRDAEIDDADTQSVGQPDVGKAAGSKPTD
jgi:hypothetical protein